MAERPVDFFESQDPEREPEGLTYDQVIAKLDAGNPAYRSLCDTLGRINNVLSGAGSKSKFNFYHVDRTFPELIDFLSRRGISPLIDKTLQLVICAIDHTALKAVLFCYQKKIVYHSEREAECSDRYIHDGMGWHLTSMGGVVMSERYRPMPNESDFFKTLNWKRSM